MFRIGTATAHVKNQNTWLHFTNVRITEVNLNNIVELSQCWSKRGRDVGTDQVTWLQTRWTHHHRQETEIYQRPLNITVTHK